RVQRCFTCFPYTTRFRSLVLRDVVDETHRVDVRAQATGRGDDGDVAAIQLIDHVLDELRALVDHVLVHGLVQADGDGLHLADGQDRKSTRLNSSHVSISY